MATFRYFVAVAQWSLDAVSHSFAPRPNATSGSIRKNGAACILIGAISMAVIGPVMIFLGATIELVLIPSMLAYTFFIVGGYRLVCGKEPVARYPGEFSSSRVLFGCFSVMLCVGSLLGFIWMLSVLFDK